MSVPSPFGSVQFCSGGRDSAASFQLHPQSLTTVPDVSGGVHVCDCSPSVLCSRAVTAAPPGLVSQSRAPGFTSADPTHSSNLTSHKPRFHGRLEALGTTLRPIRLQTPGGADGLMLAVASAGCVPVYT